MRFKGGKDSGAAVHQAVLKNVGEELALPFRGWLRFHFILHPFLKCVRGWLGFLCG